MRTFNIHKFGQALTPVQLEVLSLVAQGYDNVQIGKIVHKSPLTIKNHVQSILGKLGAYSRQNASYIAMQKGILSCPNPNHAPCEHTAETPVEVPLRPEVVRELEPVAFMPLEWLKCGDIEICLEMFSVRIRNETTKLSRHAVQLLVYMMQHPGKTFSRQSLLDVMYGSDIAVEERMVDVQVTRIRAVLIKHGYGSLIRTVKGIGYGILQLPGKAS